VKKNGQTYPGITNDESVTCGTLESWRQQQYKQQTTIHISRRKINCHRYQFEKERRVEGGTDLIFL